MSALTWWTRPATQRPGLRYWPGRIFLGLRGLRAGWRVLVFAAFALGSGLAVQALLAGVVTLPDKGEVPARIAFALEATQAVIILGITWLMARLEGRSVWSYGLSGPHAVRRLAIGWVAGLACLSALIAALAATGNIAFDGIALHGLAIPSYALIWAVGFLLVGFVEETVIRGYAQSTLTDGIGFWPAALVTSSLFAADHLTNHGETVLGVVQVFAAGLAWCLLLRVTGSLWMGIGFHAAWDWAQSYLYGTADSGWIMQGHLLASRAVGDPRMSGGADGPEGSVLASPIMLAGAVLLAWAVGRRHAASRAAGG